MSDFSTGLMNTEQPQFIGRILFEEVTPEQIMEVVGATDYRDEPPGMCFTCDYNHLRIRIFLDEANRITGLMQG